MGSEITWGVLGTRGGSQTQRPSEGLCFYHLREQIYGWRFFRLLNRLVDILLLVLVLREVLERVAKATQLARCLIHIPCFITRALRAWNPT